MKILLNKGLKQGLFQVLVPTARACIAGLAHHPHKFTAHFSCASGLRLHVNSLTGRHSLTRYSWCPSWGQELVSQSLFCRGRLQKKRKKSLSGQETYDEDLNTIKVF